MKAENARFGSPCWFTSGSVQQKETCGRNDPDFDWAIFGWAKYIIVTRAQDLARVRPPFPLISLLIDLRVIDFVSSTVW